MNLNRRTLHRLGAAGLLALTAVASAAAATLQPYDVKLTYTNTATTASAVVAWRADAPAAYGYDILRRAQGTTQWTKLRYVPEPVRSFTDTNLKPLVRYEYQVVAYRPKGPTTGYASALAATPLDFPYNVPYPYGIKPSYSQAQLNADVQAMYDKWRAVYLTANGAGDRGMRVYKPAEGGVTVSEGQGYGMLISVYMANAGNSGKADFDGLARYYKAKAKVVGGVDYGLMAWKINADGSIADNYVAPDGDIDAAYALLVADKKWGSSGEINYKAEAQRVLRGLEKYIIHSRNPDPAKNSYLLHRVDMSNPASMESSTTYSLPSYQILSYFKQFQSASGNAVWSKSLGAAYRMLDYFYNTSKSTNGTTLGLTPYTFLTQPGPNQYTKGAAGYHYGLDSGRVPWRVAMDYLWYGTANSAAHAARPESVNLARELPAANVRWFQAVTNGNPQNLFMNYTLQGVAATTTRWDQRALTAPMAVGAMTDASNQAALDALYNWLKVQEPGKPYVYPSGGQTINAGYYADAVMMVCMLALTGNMPNLPDIAP